MYARIEDSRLYLFSFHFIFYIYFLIFRLKIKGYKLLYNVTLYHIYVTYHGHGHMIIVMIIFSCFQHDFNMFIGFRV